MHLRRLKTVIFVTFETTDINASTHFVSKWNQYTITANEISKKWEHFYYLQDHFGFGHSLHNNFGVGSRCGSVDLRRNRRQILQHSLQHVSVEQKLFGALRIDGFALVDIICELRYERAGELDAELGKIFARMAQAVTHDWNGGREVFRYWGYVGTLVADVVDILPLDLKCK